MSRKTKLQEIASTIKVSKRADKTINPLWRKPGYVIGLRELRELFSTIEYDPPKFPPGATRDEKIAILNKQIESYKILSDSPLNWPEESSYLGKPV
jgi:hypothetical protein